MTITKTEEKYFEDAEVNKQYIVLKNGYTRLFDNLCTIIQDEEIENIFGNIKLLDYEIETLKKLKNKLVLGLDILEYDDLNNLQELRNLKRITSESDKLITYYMLDGNLKTRIKSLLKSNYSIDLALYKLENITSYLLKLDKILASLDSILEYSETEFDKKINSLGSISLDTGILLSELNASDFALLYENLPPYIKNQYTHLTPYNFLKNTNIFIGSNHIGSYNESSFRKAIQRNKGKSPDKTRLSDFVDYICKYPPH